MRKVRGKLPEKGFGTYSGLSFLWDSFMGCPFIHLYKTEFSESEILISFEFTGAYVYTKGMGWQTVKEDSFEDVAAKYIKVYARLKGEK